MSVDRAAAMFSNTPSASESPGSLILILMTIDHSFYINVAVQSAAFSELPIAMAADDDHWQPTEFVRKVLPHDLASRSF